MSTDFILASIPEPVTDGAIHLRSRLSSDRWRKVAADAVQRAEVLQRVDNERNHCKLSSRKSLEHVAPGVPWWRYRHWRKRVKTCSEPMWERLIDQRVPPAPERVPEAVRQVALTLRELVDSAMDCETARSHLIKRFGEPGRISDTSLRRIWSAAGLTQHSPVGRPEVKRYDGGAGLAFITAAAAETDSVTKLAVAALEAGRTAVKTQGDKTVLAEPEGRDALGRLTATYNHSVREGLEPGETDCRFSTDAEKRSSKDLATLVTVRNRPQTLASKLLSIGLYGLLTEQRGFDGLAGPRGAFLGVLGSVPYMPATLQKCLAQLALLDVGDALWSAHARNWNQVSKKWSDPKQPWLQMAVYVDASSDAYWTRRFAASSKVSQVGRIMPCLSRIAVNVGPGVPLLIETYAGSVSLKKQLAPTLKRLEAIVGDGELGRLTIVDAEMATVPTLSALMAMPERIFVTVWKGNGADPKSFMPSSRWKPYRKRDRLREGIVVLHGDGAPPDGLQLRAVEMQRKGSRRPKSTIYLTSAKSEDLSTKQVADAYLSRWPNQEQRFRNARNGLGTERSRGYGGEHVQHVALDTALEKSERRVANASARCKTAESHLDRVRSMTKDDLNTEGRATVKQAMKAAEKEKRAAEKVLERATEDRQEKLTIPRVIFKRDTTREDIATVATMTVMMLIEHVLKEYFGSLKMEFRTFIEHFVNMPVTTITTRSRITYRIEGNPRNPERTEQARVACAEATRRKLRCDGRLLLFEVVDPGGQ